MDVAKELELKDKIMAALKEEGLEVTEEAVKAFIPTLMKIIKVVVEDTETSWDDTFYTMIEGKFAEILKELAEKINPED